MEVSCLVWARALLELAYSFINEQFEGPAIAPWQIPQFRFVKSALAVEQQSAGKNGAVFLLEELIHEKEQGPFRKYLNNVSPSPLPFASSADRERAAFLAFTQHVQYWKTKKLVFVSDYQGGNSILTDPQISSASELGVIFAEGNVPSIHSNFEKQHHCNNFCKWFGLPTDYNSESWSTVSANRDPEAAAELYGQPSQ
ncbi:hypothetical protein M378DRAFT_82873 [Amanita muscaria Koide BX008]|uniref:Alpha-type protein kinase domain-containing protein n=1 Tax=Amanita muscaria (strain Koide BX008) TaxID=946122 RepID=A0A0C2SDQ6_AMAMK|nr:hypothetical protein M378DRAFT_82873 [Amanita muscaria Koide BX008]